ncbi:MAG: hypothetical protein HQK60_02540 [Deltaproteobacteria bacterium]|nr:hypothetical protein [Deltaproteobacteria bacterium]
MNSKEFILPITLPPVADDLDLLVKAAGLAEPLINSWQLDVSLLDCWHRKQSIMAVQSITGYRVLPNYVTKPIPEELTANKNNLDHS